MNIDSSFSRLWAVVDSEAHSVIFASLNYSISQSYRDRLIKSFRDACSAGVGVDWDYKNRYQLVRYDIARHYLSPTPFQAAKSAFVEEMG